MDCGVYMLVTAGADGGKEYRVAECSEIENMFLDFLCFDGDDCFCGGKPWWPGARLDMAYVNSPDYFGNCDVYTDEDEAGSYLERLASDMDQYGLLKYGMVVFDYSHLPFPEA